MSTRLGFLGNLLGFAGVGVAMTEEISRRLIGGDWKTSARKEGNGGAQPITRTTRTLTGAEINDAYANPVELVAAPASGYAIHAIKAFASYTPGTRPFGQDQQLKICPTGAPDFYFFIQGGFGLNTLDDAAGTLEEGDDTPKSRATFDGQAVSLEISALMPGGLGDSDVDSGGSGYAVNDTGTVDFGSPAATYRVDAVTGGAVTAFTITDPGAGYTLGPGYTTATGGGQPGVGTGFQVTANSIDYSSGGDGTLTVTIAHETVPLS